MARLCLLTVAELIAGGCQRPSTEIDLKATPAGQTPTAAPTEGEHVIQALSDFNRGAALLEQYQYAPAAKAFEAVVSAFPGWTAARFNLGLALLNVQGDALHRAEAVLQRVVDAQPDHRWAHFCLGVIAHQKPGEDEKALEHFEKVYQVDRDDPHVGYEYGVALASLGKTSEAIGVLERVIEQDPGFVSAFYRLVLLYNRTRQREKAAQVIARFQRLNSEELTGGSFGVVDPYGGKGKYYLALAADGLPIIPAPISPAPRVVFSPEVKQVECPLKSWRWAGGDVRAPGLACGDLDGDGDQDLVVCGAADAGGTLVLFNDGTGRFTAGPQIADRGVVPILGDVDNDGDLDVWLGRNGPELLLFNDGKGGFVQHDLKQGPPGGSLTCCARLADLDSDGDLDMLSLRIKGGSVPASSQQAAAPSSVLNNNRDGSFTEVAEALGLALPDTPASAVVIDDFDNDRDMDMLVLSPARKPLCWRNDRLGQYRILDHKRTKLDIAGAKSATSGNPFKTGNRDLLLFTGGAVALYQNRGSWNFEEDSEFSAQFGSLGGTCGQFVDIDNDGDLDLIIADAHRRDGTRGPALLLNDWPARRFVDALTVDPGNLLRTQETGGDAICVAADFNDDGRCDLLVAAMDRSPVLLENMTRGGNWMALDLRGQRPQDRTARSPSSPIGARVELRAGSVSQLYVVGTPSGATSMPPLRVQAGLGNHKVVEWLRILWPDSVLQAELEMAGGRVVSLDEINRRPTSCPHLFCWDGRQFAFVSDFGGVGGLGYRTGPSTFARPDPTEYVVLPELVPRDGDFTLQVVEPLEEVVYFDEAKLIAVDHPRGTTVHPHEMAAVSADLPPFEIFCYSEPVRPLHVEDDRGRDMTSAIRDRDRVYAEPSERDGRFTGYARDHYVELDFGDRLSSMPTDARWVLFLDGWVEYSTSTSNYAASQAGLRLEAPSIAALRHGQWVEVLHEVGYPAGINHTMTVDLTGKIRRDDSRVRITTNMDLSWDQIFLAAHRAEVALKLTEVAVREADLHFLGYPRGFSPDGRNPNLLDYTHVSASETWLKMPGAYTRYGDVTELLASADDRFAILAPGDEITLRFNASVLGPVPPGCVRTFLLKTDSYCKDMDVYTGGSDQVEPLPFHAMKTYPYGPDEHYPETATTRSDRRRYSTRIIAP
jgi:hypothetical protein